MYESERNTYKNIRQIAFNPNRPGHQVELEGERFGWNSFQEFLLQMGARPSAQHALMRRNIRKGYTRENCVWTKRSELDLHAPNHPTITLQGVTKTYREWAEDKGIPYPLLMRRVRSGKKAEEVLAPVGKVALNAPKKTVLGKYFIVRTEARTYLESQVIVRGTTVSREYACTHDRNRAHRFDSRKLANEASRECPEICKVIRCTITRKTNRKCGGFSLVS